MTIIRFFQKSNRFDKVILSVYILAFSGAAYNHIHVLKGGWFPYNRWNEPFIFNFYWTSLTFLDPLSIIILLFNLRVGLWLYLAVMVSDVSINLFSSFVYWKIPIFQQYALISQILFLLFLIVTFKRMNRLAKKIQ